MAGCVHPIPICDLNTGKLILVPCGKCLECRRAYQNEWIFRLNQEMKRIAVPIFVTLTYRDEFLPLGDFDNVTQSVVLKSDVQKFLKRFRKNGGELTKNCKYFAVGEYGKCRNRAHYHLVLLCPNARNVSEIQRVVWRSWHFGFTKTRLCTDKQIHYVCKYMNKLDKRPHLVEPFRLYSRGLGLCYLTAQMIKYYLTTFSRTCKNGKFDIPLPRYFRRKLDDMSLNHPFLKRAGLVYSDLRPEPVVQRGSRFETLKVIQETLQRCIDREENPQPHIFAGYEVWPVPRQYNFRSHYEQLFNSFHDLVMAEYESDRQLDKCKINNGLNKTRPQPFSLDYETELLEI